MTSLTCCSTARPRSQSLSFWSLALLYISPLARPLPVFTLRSRTKASLAAAIADTPCDICDQRRGRPSGFRISIATENAATEFCCHHLGKSEYPEIAPRGGCPVRLAAQGC